MIYRHGLLGLGTIVGILGDSLSRPLTEDEISQRKTSTQQPASRGNRSGHMPHQGAREMARRAKRLVKDKQP